MSSRKIFNIIKEEIEYKITMGTSCFKTETEQLSSGFQKFRSKRFEREIERIEK